MGSRRQIFGGWWRLWVVVSALWVIAAVVVTRSEFPGVFDVSIDGDIADALVYDAPREYLRPRAFGDSGWDPSSIRYDTVMGTGSATGQRFRVKLVEDVVLDTLDPTLEPWTYYSRMDSARVNALSVPPVGDTVARLVGVKLRRLRIEFVRELFMLSVLPPLGLLVIGAACGWVWRGFRGS